MDWEPRVHGWILARPASHAMMFLRRDGSWSDSALDAWELPSQRMACEQLRHHPEASILTIDALPWIKAPLLRATQTLVRR